MIPAAGAGVLTVMVPVATAHVGWVNVVVGAAGVAGCGLMVTDDAMEIQPAALLVVRLYIPGDTPLNTPVVLV